MEEKKQGSGLFNASFIYTDPILRDFETMYMAKKDMPLPTRVVLGVIGTAGAVYFGYMLYAEGIGFTRVGYLMICSIMILLALSRGRKRRDGTVEKYRKYYLNHRVNFIIDEDGVEMKLEGQKNYARSKFKEIYGLYDTDSCFYFVIQGKAYYILSKAGISGGTPEDLASYMQKKCKKTFLHYPV